MSGAGAAPPLPTLTSISLFLLLFLLPPPIHGVNLTHLTALLSAHPDLSVFTSLLLSTTLISDISDRNSVTLLAVPNSLLPPSATAAALRNHVLLRFLTFSDLRQTPPAGTLIPTLFQTPLNLTFNPSNGVVSFQPPISPNPNSTSSSANSAILLSFVTSIPSNLSIFTVSALISPTESQNLPPPAGIDIAKALIGGHIFNVAASLLNASGVLQDLQKSETGAGISLFIPTDDAFAGLPPEYDPKPLPAEKKALLLKFHVLHSYYPLGSLESIVNPVEPTMATEENGAGTFTLNISKVNGSVSLDSGLDLAVITQTVFDQNPVAIFGISNVLLPKEIFGGVKESAVVMELRNDSNGGGSYFAAPSPEFEGEIRSDDGGGAKQGILTLLCTVGLLLYL